MLVLSRHRDESIMIGDNIVITVVDVRGDKVRLGDRRVHRYLSPAENRRKISGNRSDAEARGYLPRFGQGSLFGEYGDWD